MSFQRDHVFQARMLSDAFRTVLKRAIIVLMILTLQLLCAAIPVKADGQASPIRCDPQRMGCPLEQGINTIS